MRRSARTSMLTRAKARESAKAAEKHSPPKESVLDLIERTAPKTISREERRDEPAQPLHNGKPHAPEPVAPKTTEQSSEQERKLQKTEEVQRRLEALTKAKQDKQPEKQEQQSSGVPKPAAVENKTAKVSANLLPPQLQCDQAEETLAFVGCLPGARLAQLGTRRRPRQFSRAALLLLSLASPLAVLLLLPALQRRLRRRRDPRSVCRSPPVPRQRPLLRPHRAGSLSLSSSICGDISAGNVGCTSCLDIVLVQPGFTAAARTPAESSHEQRFYRERGSPSRLLRPRNIAIERQHKHQHEHEAGSRFAVKCLPRTHPSCPSSTGPCLPRRRFDQRKCRPSTAR